MVCDDGSEPDRVAQQQRVRNKQSAVKGAHERSEWELHSLRPHQKQNRHLPV